MQIIQKGGRQTVTRLERRFDCSDCPGAWYGFDVDAQGEIIVTPDNQDNVAKCLAGDVPVIDRGNVPFSVTTRIPRLGRCDCGETVNLDGFTNRCSCGRYYASSGQRLSDPSLGLWGEETGETAGEILAVA